MTWMRACLWILGSVIPTTTVWAHSTSEFSRHLLLEDLSMVVLLADAQQTPGPFAEQDNDYVTDTNDLTAAGRAGSPGIVGGDRTTVVDGVPLALNITVYDVSKPSLGGVELPNVEVFLWHTDAAGVYSAVGDNRQELENTEGQVWCRGIQSTDAQGVAAFETILPGWYPGRAIHYHVRFRFPGQTEFAATTQFYIRDEDLLRYQSVPPYSRSPYPITPLYSDGIFYRLNDPRIQEMLTLTLDGRVRTGFSSSIHLGIVPPEGYTLLQPTVVPTMSSTTTDQPTMDSTAGELTIQSTTIDPTTSLTTLPTPLPEPVPRPTFAFAAPVPSLAPSPAQTTPVITPTTTPILTDPQTFTQSKAVVSTATRPNTLLLAAATFFTATYSCWI